MTDFICDSIDADDAGVLQSTLSTGLVFGSRVKRFFPRCKMRAHGGFLIIGGCQNIWI
jgi:hypothetical protein